VRWVDGHCAGLQIVLIGDGKQPGAVYLSDLIPTTAQVPLDCYLSYDLNVERLSAEKERILDEAATRHDLLMFVHAPRLRAGYLVRHSGGGYGVDAREV